jgi:hypothetical protein
MRWMPKSALLFGVAIALLLLFFIALPSLPYFSEHPQKLNWYDGIFIAVSGLIAARLYGLISNLVRDYENRYYFLQTAGGMKENDNK